MRPLLLLLAAACAVRAPGTFYAPSPAALDTPTLVMVNPLTPPVVLAEDPPLPGLPLVGWPGLGEPESGPLLSEAEVVARGLEHHPAVRAALAEQTLADAERSRAGLLDPLHIEAEWSPGEEVEAEVLLDVSNMYQTPLRARVATSTLEAAQQRADAARVRVTHELRARLYEAQAAAASLSIAQQGLDTLAAGRDTAAALFAAGNAPALDTSARIAAYERARIEVADLELRHHSARTRLASAAGLTGTWRLAPLDPVPELRLPEDLETQAVAANLDLAARRAELDALAREAAYLHTTAWPELEIGVAGGWLPDEGWSPQLLVRGSAPAIRASRSARAELLAQIQVTRARTEAEAWSIREIATILEQDARAAHARALHLRDVVLPLQRQVSEETLRQYNAMQLGIFELLEAERAELEVARAEVAARQAWWMAYAAVTALLEGVVVNTAPPPVSINVPESAGGH